MYKVENIASLIVIKPVEVYIMDFTDVNMYQYKCMKNVYESFWFDLNFKRNKIRKEITRTCIQLWAV